MLWGLGVGYVISGMYFGWNLGLVAGGTLGMAIATGFIIVMYAAFSFSYSELACSIPRAGGAFDYASRALGRNWGFIAGFVQVIEFVFAPPAIAFGIGSYFNLLFPGIPIPAFAIAAYILFTGLNIYGVKAAASFELIVTIIALAGLLLFAGVTVSHFKITNLIRNAYPHGWSGTFAAIPFAIWFFLGIEGVANVAEEVLHPQKDIIRGFGSAIATLIFLCILTFVCAVGVGGWEMVVLHPETGMVSDSPLPLAIEKVTGTDWVFSSFIGVGTFGLVASFHGLLLAAGRATFEMGRVKYFPSALGKVHGKFKTPYTALIFNMIIGVTALLTGKTGEIITIAVFGALVLYIISMVSLLQFRKREPSAHRPFRVPFYPYTPVVALVIAVFSLAAMIVYYKFQALLFFCFLAISFLIFKIFVQATK